jgi:hypothetical protein
MNAVLIEIGMRFSHTLHIRLLLPLALLLMISCVGKAQPSEVAATSPTSAYPWVFLAQPTGLSAVNMNTGEVYRRKLVKGALPYTSTPLPSGLTLLSYIGWDLKVGNAVINESGTIEARFPGYRLTKLGGDALIGVKVRDVLEKVPGEAATTLIKLTPKLQASEFPRSLPLPPVGMLLDGTSEPLSEPLLLLTYRESEAAYDPSYPWALDLTFRAFDEGANALWKTDVRTNRPVADLELIGNCGGVMLIWARYDYIEGEYIGLDANDGTLLWQRRSTVIPLAQDDYPYVDFIYQLPLEVTGRTAWIPAYDSRYQDAGKCIIDLTNGDSQLDVDKAWVKLANDEWRKRQSPAEIAGAREWDLGGGDVLKLADDKLELRRGGAKLWERALAPHFGGGLELAQSGGKLLLLVETPIARGGSSSQGLAHLIDRTTGIEPLAQMEATAQYFSPLFIGGKWLLLDGGSARLLPMPTIGNS